MAPLWQRLRDSYLPSFLAAIKNSNPPALVSPFTFALARLPIVAFQAEAFWMTASEQVPFKPPFDPSTRRSPRWDDIPAINFTTLGGNTISPASVTRAIEVRQVRFTPWCSDRCHFFRRCQELSAVDPQRAIWSLRRPRTLPRTHWARIELRCGPLWWNAWIVYVNPKQAETFLTLHSV